MTRFRLHEDVVTPLNNLNLPASGVWANIDIIVVDVGGVITILGFIWQVSQYSWLFSQADDASEVVDALLEVKAYLAGEDRPEDVCLDALDRYQRYEKVSYGERTKCEERGKENLATWRVCIKSIPERRRQSEQRPLTWEVILQHTGSCRLLR
ncbi:hypothetical protein BC835DRAFT_331306 [Cytidiella melzeri]|nr:hypothetical protein BC835DRAFT_331306 [Cytidiella melzeri]